MDLKPGRELDALIAEKVMGWKKNLTPMGYRWTRPVGHPAMNTDAAECPNYSTDIAQAWDVLEQIQDHLDPLGRAWQPTISYCGEKYGWRTEFDLVNDNPGDDISMYWANGITAPHAICLAALKAVESSA